MEETEYAFLRSRGLCVVFCDQKGTMGFPRLSAEIKILQPLAFEQIVKVRLKLVELDGKQIVYDFEIVDDEQNIAIEGSFKAACCRFPGNDSPFAVLIPEDVIEALTQEPLLTDNEL